MKRVYIITEGGKDIGFGHIARCVSLSEAFEERGIQTEFIVNGDETVGYLIKGRRYQIFNWLKEEDNLFKIIKGASIAIIDSYLADARFYKRLSETVEIPVYIDDNKRLDYPGGFIVNGTINAEELYYQRRLDTTYLLGSQYIPLRKEFRNVREKEIKDTVENVMVTFGGDDSMNMTPKILKLLCENSPFFTKKVIIGKGFSSIDEIKRLKDEKTEFIYNPDAETMKKIMLQSDIAISGGGQTLYELARVGLPAVAVCVAENQERNLKGWQKKGFIEYAGWHGEGNLKDKLKKSIEHLADVGVRKNKTDIGKKLVDGRGGFRVVKSALSVLFRNKLALRNASFDDASDILTLANDDTVRRNSFNPEKIEWEEHVKWLTEKLDDNNCVFFIVSMRDTFYGQIRFDINPEKKEAIVNISLKKEIRGLSLGSFLLNKAICEFLKIHSDIKIIKAYIKKTNVASLKTFEGADFKFSEDTIIKGNKAKVHIREIEYAKGQYVS